jgi:glycosyltransferase involved in cell wall biosynthesis
VLEGMAAGLVPIVSPTLSEMVAHGRGFVVPYESPSAIARIVTTVWGDSELLKSTSMRAQRWARTFTADSSASQVVRVLKAAGLNRSV